MDKYLINKDRLKMFNRIINKTDNTEYSEKIIKIFFNSIIPKIEQDITKPYALFKYFTSIFKDEATREILFEEIILFYLESKEPYKLFKDKINLDLFINLICEEHSRLFDKLGFAYNTKDLLYYALQEIKKDLDCIHTLSNKKNYLLEKKMEFSMILNYDLVYEIDKLLNILNNQIENNVLYIDYSRIEELQNIAQSNWDTTKLVQLCEELNQAYIKKNYITIPLLIRAIIDHTPPIFGKNGFKEVTSQHGTKSFKESMSHLDNTLRKIADAMIHTQIRGKEILPSHAQIDFRADLDVLLSEVCRILK